MLLNTNYLMVNSPLEQFEVTNLIGINAPILGYLNITLTNLGLYSLLVLFLITGIHYAGNNEVKLVPSTKRTGSSPSSFAAAALRRNAAGTFSRPSRHAPSGPKML